MESPDDETAAMLAQLLSDFEPEPLLPELRAYLCDGPYGLALKHPLVMYPFYSERHNKLVNAAYRSKSAQIADARHGGDYEQYIWLHERPYRVDAFMDIEHNLSDEQYWTMLSMIWVDSENIRQCPEEWESLLRSDRSCREQMMEEDEIAALVNLPETVTIYQGHTSVRDDGWSWTTSRTIAEWFARRFAMLEKDEPQLTTAKVAKSEITAYLLRRGESEVVVDPSSVIYVSTESLDDDGS